jgi:hypothetical protein
MPINGDSPRDWVPRPPAHLGKTAVKQGLYWRGKITGLDDDVEWEPRAWHLASVPGIDQTIELVVLRRSGH